MTEALVTGLRNEPRVVICNIDTQASRSLAEKGGKHQLRKSLRGALQTVHLLERIVLIAGHHVEMEVEDGLPGRGAAWRG